MNFSMFDNHIDATFIIDETRSIQYANQSACTILSISLKRIKYETPIFEYITFEDSSLFCMPDGQRGKDEFSPYREMAFKTFKGAEGTGLVSISPVQNSLRDFQKSLWTVFIKDMTVEIQLQKKYKDQLDQKQNVIDELNIAKEKLKKYSEDLEAMVEERTQELSDANRFINTMINSLDQGLLVFDKNGLCQDIYSKACLNLFNVAPPKKYFWDVLSISDEKTIQSTKQWVQLIFQEMLPFEDAVPLGPIHCQVGNKHIQLNYFPMQNSQEQLEGIVAVAYDISEQVKAKKLAKEQSEHVQMILKIIKDKNRFIHFISDSKHLLSDLSNRLTKNIDEKLFFDTCRILHTVKGGASLYSLQEIANTAHQYEEQIQPLKDLANKKNADYLNKFTELKDELTQNLKHLQAELNRQLEQLKDIVGQAAVDGKARLEIPIELLLAFQKKIKSKELNDEFRQNFLKLPLWGQFEVFNNLMQELAIELNKRILPIKFSGENILIDPITYRPFFDSLVHLFRNIIDHGIECEEIRIEKDKDPHGSVKVATSLQDKFLMITIEDDGAGINCELIKEKLLGQGMDETEVNKLTPHQLCQFIFEEGFSTRSEISEISGRGVGMDAIKDTVRQMQGNVEVFSRFDKGTRFEFRIPIDIE